MAGAGAAEPEGIRRIARGGPPRGLAFSLAALLWFYRGRMANGAYVGSRDGVDYPIRDEADVIAAFADAWATRRDNMPALTQTLLSRAELWGEDLTRLPGLAEHVAAGLAAIARDGMRAAVETLAARM